MEVIGRIASLSKYRSGEYACTAYVTFRDAYALETALLLNVSWCRSYLLILSLLGILYSCYANISVDALGSFHVIVH